LVHNFDSSHICFTIRLDYTSSWIWQCICKIWIDWHSVFELWSSSDLILARIWF